jgi:hypothetical protein
MRAFGDEFTWNRSTMPQVIDFAEAARVMATDACTTNGFGYIALQFDAAEERLIRDAPDQELAGPWRWDPHDSRDIFLMEMEAATKGIRAVCPAFPWSRSLFWHVTTPSCVSRCGQDTRRMPSHRK